MWVAFLPVARTPSWHDEQLLTMPEWVNVAGFHASVVWQLSQPRGVGMWFASVPVAWVPSWQEAQVPRTWAWSTVVAGFHTLVPWQAAQALVVWR